MPHWAIADLINWGWLRIGPPYIYININPVIFQMGPLAVRWYGLMYVVGILVGLQVVTRYTARKGISEEALYRTLWWAIAAGLLGGRLYFVIQQHDLVQDYLQKPLNILATWKGGMAFYGAIFLVIPTLYWRSRAEGVNPLVIIDAGVLFATAGQIFGRIGNLINGDIIGFKSTLPWSTVYVNPNSWACNPYIALPTCSTPVQPAAGYELISNLVLLVVMLYLARRVTRPGILMLVYLFSYSIVQFFLFFVRDNSIETPFGLNWGLKQAQWTSLALLIVLLPITYWVLRTSKPVPAGKIAATYGIPQRFRKQYQQASFGSNEIMADQDEEMLHLKQDSGLGSNDTEVLLEPDPDPVVDSDHTQVDLEPDPDTTLGPDDTEVLLEPDPDPVVDSDHTQVDLEPDPDTTLGPDDIEIREAPDPDTALSSDNTEVLLEPDPDPVVESDNTQVDLDTDPEPDSSSASDSAQAELHPSNASDNTQIEHNSSSEHNSSLASDNTPTEAGTAEVADNSDSD